MPSNLARSQHPALVVMDPRLDAATGLWAAHSTVGEAEPRADLPKPAGVYQGSLRAHGPQKAALTVRVQSAGLPGGDPNSAGIVTSADGQTDWTGWEGPGAPSYWEAVTYSATIADYRTDPHIAVTPADTLLLAARVGSVTNITLEVYRRAAGTTSWGAPIAINTRGQTPVSPCLVQIGAQTLLIAMVQERASSLWYPWTWTSTDDGASWAVASAPAAPDTSAVNGVASTIIRVRAAYANGQIILFVHQRSGTANTTYQYASDDLGATFYRVATLASEGYLDVIAVNGQFLVMSAAFSGGSVSTRVRRYGSAFQGPAAAILTSAIDSATAFGVQYLTDTGSATVSLHNGFALARDEDGAVYALACYRSQDPDTRTYRGQVIVSYDAGSTWSPWGMDTFSAATPTGYGYTARWWSANSGDSGVSAEAVYPTDFAAVAFRGRLVVPHNWAAPVGTLDNSLGVLYLGALTSNVTLPPINRGARYADQASYDWTWLPFERPSDMPNTVTWTGGAGTLQTPGRLALTTNLGAPTSYGTFDDPAYRDPTQRDSVGETIIAEAAFEAVDNPDTSTNRIAFKVRADDGAYGYQVSVRQNTVAILIYDDVSGTLIGQTGLLTVGPKAVRVGLNGATGKVTVFWRYWTDGDRRDWTHIVTDTLTSDGGTVGRHRIEFGQFAGAAANVTSRWMMVCASFGSRSGFSNVGTAAHWDSYDAPTYTPDTLKPRHLPAPPLRAYAQGEAYLSGARGPFLQGQTWTVSPTAVYAARRILPQVSRSPRLGWRSKADNTQQILAFQLQASGADSLPPSPVMALILRGINWRLGAIQARVGGTWTTQATIDAALGGTTYSVAAQGDSAQGGAYSAAAPYFATGELRGWTLEHGLLRRRIRHNTEGKLVNGTYSGPLTKLFAENGAAFGTGTANARLWSPDIAVVFPFTANADGWRVVIDAQNTADDYYTIGQMVLGPLHLLAAPYSWGRTQTTERGNVIEVQPDRTTYLARPAPARRSVQMTWADGVDETQLWAAEPEPDFVDYDSADASASPAATLHSLTGLLNEADGRMVALLPKIKLPLTATQTIHRKAGIIVGTASAEDQIDTIQGDELTDEVHRSGNLVITEEV